MATSGYQLDFNQDFTSVYVLDGSDGFRIFNINSCDEVEEIYAEHSEHIILVERLFNSSLLVMVTAEKPHCLQMVHFKKNQKICNCVYPTKIISIRMNRARLIVCLSESIHIHDIRDMKMLYAIEDLPPNELGVCSLSCNSLLAFPVCHSTGMLALYNTSKLEWGLTIDAHKSKLSAINFSPNSLLLATASERGTVIRLFNVKNGQRLQEFRRGVKRCVDIASLVFSVSGQFICITSNTETVHIFKIDERTDAAMKAVKDAAAVKRLGKAEQQQTVEEPVAATTWSNSFTRAVTSYILPTQVSDVLAQDRAFATVVLAQPGMRHVCGLTFVKKELKVLVASEEGFLYIHEFNADLGGVCKLQAVHDLRGALDGVEELSLSDNGDKMSPGSSNKEANRSTVPTTSTVDANQSDSTPKNTTTPTTSGRNISSEATSEKSDTTSCMIEYPCPLPENLYATSEKSDGAGCMIEYPYPLQDNSYADILKGRQPADRAKVCSISENPAEYRKAVIKSAFLDEHHFPPVSYARRFWTPKRRNEGDRFAAAAKA
ncbi:WD repeat domain phosphoinositide-interacting protein 2 isoform X1 [Anastrepha ludens]|uniref:WD repeat domain phosphoinositide-interacting protein 2 isoform X1 n=1 Tax=Anastrepha ludens TaxID=28586 RepID=UPI0023B1FC8C|nr:WD repeat domain phosphoinositide-interacting protein 2 isoform X1 [Anastrepha ludens]